MRSFGRDVLDYAEAYADKYLDYDPESGKLFYKINSNRGRILAGSEAGKPGPYGYLRLSLFVNGKPKDMKVHRLVWFIHYREWPGPYVDHIDHCKTNNRISNLRSVTNGENLRNSNVAQNNTSGYTGVTWNKLSGKWQAQYMKDQKMKYIGVFPSKEDANAAVVAARLADGFHDNHGTSL